MNNLFHITELIIDFFSNITLKKLIGLVMVAGGMWIVSLGSRQTSGDRFVLFALLGLFVAGIGAVIIYYDIAKDKATHGTYQDLEVLAKAQKTAKRSAQPAGWQMDTSKKAGKKHS